MKVNTITHNEKSKYKSSSSKNYIAQNNKIYMLPFIFLTAILPFIMRLHEYNTRLSVYKWFPANDDKIDVFLFYKQIFFIIVSSIILILIFYKIHLDKKTIKLSPILLPLAIYGLLSLLSTIFSKYPSFGFTGIYEQFESIFVIIGYCLVVYYAFLFIKTEDDIRFIFHYLLISVLVMGLLGISQAIGHDFIGSELAKSLFMPSKYIGKLGLDFNFGPKRVYLTLYNPNYVGVYVSLIAPILAGLLLTEKNKKKIILYLLALAGMLISLVGSQSKTCLISLSFVLILIIIFFRRYIFRKTKAIIAAISIVATAIILLLAINFNTIAVSVNTLFNIPKTIPALTNIKTNENLTITYKGNDLIISFLKKEDGVSILMNDSKLNVIDYTVDNENGSFIITDERFAGIQITPTMYKNLLCFQVKIDGKGWNFTNQTGDNTYYYINPNGKFDKIDAADSALFTGYEKFASSRGYIWSRTIPLLKNNILFGSGADTFSLVFPQQDYVGLYNAGFDGQLITRPHNMFLQMGVQSGVLSLIAFLVFYGIYFFSSIKLYIKGTFTDFYYQAGVAIFLGSVGYMISGITNDSTITVAPVFWVLIGIGITINYKIKHISKENS